MFNLARQARDRLMQIPRKLAPEIVATVTSDPERFVPSGNFQLSDMWIHFDEVFMSRFALFQFSHLKYMGTGYLLLTRFLPSGKSQLSDM
jgi:hypothetical protein